MIAAFATLAITAVPAAAAGEVVGLYSPSDPMWPDQAYLRHIGADAAWDVTLGSPAIRIAVVDSGIEASHLDLAGRVCAPRRDYVGDAVLHWHGTAVAGIAAAEMGTVGIAGVAQACLLDFRVLDSRNTGTWQNVELAIRDATAAEADIVLLAVGGTGAPASLRDAIQDATAAGIFVVGAAGNLGCSLESLPQGTVVEPAAYPEVFAVAGTEDWGFGVWGPATDSSCGEQVDLSAPASGILGPVPTGYRNSRGTSFSAAIVAGGAALVLGAHPGSTAAEIGCHLVATSQFNALPAPWLTPIAEIDLARAVAKTPDDTHCRSR